MEIEMIPATKKEEEAVRKTLKMWKFLAENPGSTKLDFLATIPERDWPKRHGDDCYLCDVWGFAKNEFATVCYGCPLNEAGAFCGRTHSPYTRWGMAVHNKDNGDTTTPALEIVKILEDWLAVESPEPPQTPQKRVLSPHYFINLIAGGLKYGKNALMREVQT